MKTTKILINANDNTNVITIPEEYRGKDIVVNIVNYTPVQKKKIDPRKLIGIIKDTGKTLDDYRYERLINV